ncbi:MAG: hypothetical protein WC663_02280 [Patescibacteria group bacterium]
MPKDWNSIVGKPNLTSRIPGQPTDIELAQWKKELAQPLTLLIIFDEDELTEWNKSHQIPDLIAG